MIPRYLSSYVHDPPPSFLSTSLILLPLLWATCSNIRTSPRNSRVVTPQSSQPFNWEYAPLSRRKVPIFPKQAVDRKIHARAVIVALSKISNIVHTHYLWLSHHWAWSPKYSQEYWIEVEVNDTRQLVSTRCSGIIPATHKKKKLKTLPQWQSVVSSQGM